MRTPGSATAAVHHAVILAAGRGTRLRPLTDELPKPLLPVGQRPVIVHILDGLAMAGIDEVCIVTGYRGEMIEAELGNGEASGIAIQYVRQPIADGTARALALAHSVVAHQRFVFSWADILVDPQNYRAVIRSARLADAAIAINAMDDLSAGGAVYTSPLAPGQGDGSLLVTDIVEKPRPGTSATPWNNAGFGVLGPEIWPVIDELPPSERGEYELPAAIRALVRGGLRVVAVPVQGQWFDIGTRQSLAAARAAFATRSERGR